MKDFPTKSYFASPTAPSVPMIVATKVADIPKIKNSSNHQSKIDLSIDFCTSQG